MSEQRSTWSGSLSVGLVSLPVSLYPTADSSVSISFHQYHTCRESSPETGSQIRKKTWCPACNVEVPASSVHRGYEYAKGQHVVVTDKDLESVKVSGLGDRMVVDVVTSDPLDPIFIEATYLLVPDRGAEQAFETIRQALGKNYALAKLSVRDRVWRVALQASSRGFLVYKLRGVSSVRGWDDVAAPLVPPAPDAAALRLARQLFNRMRGTFKYEDVRDERTERLAALLAAKTTGQPLPVFENESTSDFSLQLKQSLLAATPVTPVKVQRGSGKKTGVA